MERWHLICFKVLMKICILNVMYQRFYKNNKTLEAVLYCENTRAIAEEAQCAS